MTKRARKARRKTPRSKRAPPWKAPKRPVKLEVYFFDSWCFVRHPADRALWLRVPACVGLAPCSACNAGIGVPCTGAYGQWTRSVHVDRKDAAILALRR